MPRRKLCGWQFGCLGPLAKIAGEIAGPHHLLDRHLLDRRRNLQPLREVFD
jgi:hypothetical protein